MPVDMHSEQVDAHGRLQDTLPDLTSTQRLPGLCADVRVWRDQWGIPHINAQSEWDMFFAQGFTTAQDRLFHMDADRHQALGRWAEWVGPVGVAADRLLRAAGMGRTARGDYDACAPDARAMIDAYSAGVNAFITATRAAGVVPSVEYAAQPLFANSNVIAAIDLCSARSLLQCERNTR